MTAATEEMTITYGAVSIGGSTARKIDGWTRDESDYTNSYFEFEFVTTAASDALLVAELNTLRAEFRKPRLDLVVLQNGETYLSRRHSANTALNTFPRITKEGDPADTGRSHHFTVRIEYELPADNVSTNFRRGSTVNVQYTPSRRRTVTISGIYTANSSDGTTMALAQYSAQIAAFESAELDVIDAAATWEQIGEPQVEFFETNKLLSFTRVYREVNLNQSPSGLDDVDIVDPQLIIIRNKLAPGDSIGGGLVVASGTGTVAGQGVNAGTVSRPVFVHIDYATNIDFNRTVDLNGKWNSSIRPFLFTRAGASEGQQGVILIDEKVSFDYYENRIIASMDFIAYTSPILMQRITHRDVTAYGRVLVPVTEKDPFSFYDYQGPSVRQRIVTEEREEVTDTSDVKVYVDSKVMAPGFTTNFGDSWVPMTREPVAAVLRKGMDPFKFIAEVKIETVLQFRNKKAVSKANAGGVTGGTVTPG